MEHLKAPVGSRSALPVLVFELAGQYFALPITHVREVLPRATLIPMPEAPASLLGLLRLRGTLLPVLDLRQRLGLPASVPAIRQCIVVTQVAPQPVGLLVDEAPDLTVFPDAGRIPHHTVPTVPAPLIDRALDLDGRVVTVLNPEAIIGAELLAFLASILPASSALGRPGSDEQRQGQL